MAPLLVTEQKKCTIYENHPQLLKHPVALAIMIIFSTL